MLFKNWKYSLSAAMFMLVVGLFVIPGFPCLVLAGWFYCDALVDFGESVA